MSNEGEIKGKIDIELIIFKLKEKLTEYLLGWPEYENTITQMWQELYGLREKYAKEWEEAIKIEDDIKRQHTKAEIINKILSKEFKVFSACCKICGIDKSEFGLGKQKKENKPDVTCNPIGQATILNNKNTQLNVILGLCLGHDILFTKHSEAPVTTLVVKDRVLAHNPIGAIYSGYYLKKKFELNQ